MLHYVEIFVIVLTSTLTAKSWQLEANQMAITSSAKKAIRVAARRRIFNLRRKRAVGEVEARVRRFIAAGKTGDAQKLVPALYKAIDKAAKTNYIKKGAAARKKSRIVALIQKTASKGKK